jgi:hypothetical protein
MVGFLYFMVCSFSDFSRSIKHCEKPLLVRTFPFLFLINSLFQKEGLVYRNLAFKKLLFALLCWVVPVLTLLFFHGEIGLVLK